MIFRFASGVVLSWALVLFAQNTPAPFSIQWNTNSSIVRLTGPLPAAHQSFSSEQIAELFPVTVEPANIIQSIGLPAMAGTYAVSHRAIIFTPRFPFAPGVTYRATYLPAKLSSVLRVPRPTLARETRVAEIFPTTNTLPQNLLKFYVHFSAPMSGGMIYEHIHLLQEDGTPVELPFLEIDEELWNPEMTRLTLFLDPGRIKREVRPLEEIGPALVPGKRYILQIGDGWLDARGAPLLAGFSKTFSVATPDRSPPDPASWKITAPHAGTRAPLLITFDEPLDHALAARMISIPGMDGNITVGPSETSCVFSPARPWPSGRHELLVLSTIEDLAGNNIGKPFEVDLAESPRPRERPRTHSLFFQIN